MARIRTLTTLLLGLALPLTGCEQQTAENGEMSDMAADTVAAVDDEAELDALRSSYEESWNAGDIDAILVMMTPEYEEVGPEGVMNYDDWSAMMSDSANAPPEGATLSIETQTLEIAESGDIAYGSGISTMTIPMDGEEMTDSSRWVAGFKKVDGQWKIDRLAFTGEAEPMGGEAEPMGGASDTTESM